MRQLPASQQLMMCREFENLLMRRLLEPPPQPAASPEIFDQFSNLMMKRRRPSFTQAATWQLTRNGSLPSLPPAANSTSGAAPIPTPQQPTPQRPPPTTAAYLRCRVSEPRSPAPYSVAVGLIQVVSSIYWSCAQQRYVGCTQRFSMAQQGAIATARRRRQWRWRRRLPCTPAAAQWC